MASSTVATSMEPRLQQLQDIIGTDAGGRGMQSLICPGDLAQAARWLAGPPSSKGTVVILSGFPCCVTQTPPTETDGPPGTFAIARAAAALGWSRVVVAVDDCNRAVFQACLDGLALPAATATIELASFPAAHDQQPLSAADQARLDQLAADCDLLIACERAGPAADGHCYTMRCLDMTMAGLIAPLHDLVVTAAQRKQKIPFIAIGDGGNELGMGKVLPHILKIPSIARAACVVPADYLIAASVSNWGGYALAAGAAVCRAQQGGGGGGGGGTSLEHWVAQCLPTPEEETALLQRAVAAGCRDGVSGQMEATVDGMPLSRSMQCLQELRSAALGITSETPEP